MNFLIVGLGNPGEKYKNNRHNVGHIFIEYIKQENKSKVFHAIKTAEFMNDSGNAVKKIVTSFKFQVSKGLFVAHDDLDLRLGNFKIQKGTGPKIHNGLRSIEDSLGTKDFWRIRIGVDNRDSDHHGSGEDYVLGDFTKEENQILKSVFPQILTRLILVQKNLEKT